MDLRKFAFGTDAPSVVLLVRLAVGAFFFPKHPEISLSGRIGRGPICQDRHSRARGDGAIRRVVEIVCGTLLIAGLLTRFAAIPLIVDMIVAISTTKLPLLVKSGFWATGTKRGSILR